MFKGSLFAGRLFQGLLFGAEVVEEQAPQVRGVSLRVTPKVSLDDDDFLTLCMFVLREFV